MSRQQDWQWRKLKDGLCSKCGKLPCVSAWHCESCLAKFRARIALMRAKARAFRRRLQKSSERNREDSELLVS